MKHDKHAPHVRGLDKREGPAHERRRQGAEPNSSDSSYATMPYPVTAADEWQHDYYGQSTSAPVSTRPTISAMLNHGDYSEYKAGYSATSDRGNNSSKMALQNALSPVVPTPADNTFASVMLSNQRTAAPTSDAYTYGAQEPQTEYSTYTSSEDFQKGKSDLDYSYYYADDQTQPPDSGTNHRATSGSKNSRHRATSYASGQPRETKPKKSSSKGHKASGRQKYTPPSTTISSPVFSAPNTPNQQTPRLGSIDTGSFGSSENEDDEDDESYMFNSTERTGASRDNSIGPLGQPRGEAHPPPAVQRERNRVAATKCRAKSKAAISRLEEDEKTVSDQRNSLSAEKSALMNEVLNLRMELLKHGHCHTDGNIQNYLQNAARMIGHSGGSNPIWGPDGSGESWAASQREGGKKKRS